MGFFNRNTPQHFNKKSKLLRNKTVESILTNKIINIKVKNINVNIIDDVNYVIEDSCL